MLHRRRRLEASQLNPRNAPNASSTLTSRSVSLSVQLKTPTSWIHQCRVYHAPASKGGARELHAELRHSKVASIAVCIDGAAGVDLQSPVMATDYSGSIANIGAYAAPRTPQESNEAQRSKVAPRCRVPSKQRCHRFEPRRCAEGPVLRRARCIALQCRRGHLSEEQSCP